MSLKPLGIFWDIENCQIPKNMTANDCVKQLREFIINKFNRSCVEYMFCCACDTKLLDDSITESLNRNGVDILHVKTSSKVDADQKLRENIERFVDHHGFDSIVVIITSDIDFSPSVRSSRRKEVTVLLIYGNNASKELIASSELSVYFNDIFDHNNSEVSLSISNIPTNKSRKVIRDSFIPFCDSFNCKFRSQRKGFAKLVFNNIEDAERAESQLNELEFFGQELVVELNNSVATSSASNSPINGIQRPLIAPQNDDNCKSVLIGLFTKKNDNVVQKVKNIINSWNEDISEDIIYRVNRERDFADRDGKATLIVTTIDAKSNDKLLMIAKYKFVNREKKIYWNRLRRSKKEVIHNECGFGFDIRFNKISVSNEPIVPKVDKQITRSVAIGLWTKHDENVLKLIRKLINSWGFNDLNGNQVISVDRSEKWYGKDGKSPLIVTMNSVENHNKLLNYALKKFINKRNKTYWKPLKEKLIDSDEYEPEFTPINAFTNNQVLNSNTNKGFNNQVLISNPSITFIDNQVLTPISMTGNYLPIIPDMAQSYAEIASNSVVTESKPEEELIQKFHGFTFIPPKRRDNCICQ